MSNHFIILADWSLLLDNIPWLIAIIYGITAISVVFAIVLEKRDPIKTISWILVILLVPVIGIIWYLIFGQNFRKQKLFSRKGVVDEKRMSTMVRNQMTKLKDEQLAGDPHVKSKGNIIKLLLNSSRSILTEYNQIDIMNDGITTFESIIYELERAKDHIHLEFYRLEDDEIGNQIRRILLKKAQEGVLVRIIYDDVGSWHLTRRYIRSLKKAGIEIYPFMRVRFPYFTSKVNFRNHRKILVIDGKVGFVGGINIADKYIKGTRRFAFWRDTHLKVEGEAVGALQTVFIIDWYFVSGEIISDRRRFLKKRKAENRCLVQITTSGPDSDWASIMQAYFLAITTAKERIYISTPYFSPNESILNALVTAALSGIDVRVILPFHSDSTISFWNSTSYIGELLEAGIRVYLYKNGFTHAKLLMVDGILSAVGSANMDNRSFDLNFEVNAMIYDRVITGKLEKTFFEDLEHSDECMIESWNKRPRIKRLKESLARILGPLY